MKKLIKCLILAALVGVVSVRYRDAPVEEIARWDPVLPTYIQHPVKKAVILNNLLLSITGYCLTGPTATGTKPRVGIIALSQDLIKTYTKGAPFRYGDTVHIHGVGKFVIEDCMAETWNNRGDIWFPTKEEAKNWGIRRVKVSVVKG